MRPSKTTRSRRRLLWYDRPMSQPTKANYAFIDSQNLNLSIQNLGWKLDYTRFRRYLHDKYHVTRAFIFIGYMEEQTDLYSHLEIAGYELIYKPTLNYKDGSTKGNVDAELVMHAMIELPNYHKAVIVTGDGDFYSLIAHLISVNKLEKVVIPSQARYSSLLKRFDPTYLAFVSDLKRKLAYTHKRKEPRTDQPAEGAFRGDSSSNHSTPSHPQQ
jgi:uncharacterized LabA/DUF88 family protein